MTVHTPERDAAYIAFAETLPVYFAYSEALHLVKIGFSSNVRQRLQTIPSDRRAAKKLVLVGWILGGPRVEAELHEIFSTFHEEREWFTPAPEMAEYLDEQGEEGDPPVRQSDFRVSTYGYWAARRRLADAETRERVVVDFGNGLSLRTRETVFSAELEPSVIDRIAVKR